MPRNTSGLKRDAGPGRPKGSRDKYPRSFRKLAEQFCEDHGKDIWDGMKADIDDKQNRPRLLAILASLEQKRMQLAGDADAPVAVRFVKVDSQHGGE